LADALAMLWPVALLLLLSLRRAGTDVLYCTGTIVTSRRRGAEGVRKRS